MNGGGCEGGSYWKECGRTHSSARFEHGGVGPVWGTQVGQQWKWRQFGGISEFWIEKSLLLSSMWDKCNEMKKCRVKQSGYRYNKKQSYRVGKSRCTQMQTEALYRNQALSNSVPPEQVRKCTVGRQVVNTLGLRLQNKTNYTKQKWITSS